MMGKGIGPEPECSPLHLALPLTRENLHRLSSLIVLQLLGLQNRVTKRPRACASSFTATLSSTKATL